MSDDLIHTAFQHSKRALILCDTSSSCSQLDHKTEIQRLIRLQGRRLRLKNFLFRRSIRIACHNAKFNAVSLRFIPRHYKFKSSDFIGTDNLGAILQLPELKKFDMIVHLTDMVPTGNLQDLEKAYLDLRRRDVILYHISPYEQPDYIPFTGPVLK